jgi:hypothetical protein
MGREIRAYAIGNPQSDEFYFLIREKGKPDRRIAKLAGISLFDAVNAIALAHDADSIHILRTNDPSNKSQVDVLAFLPLDDTREVKFPTVN